jgi:hypothetical protein
MRKKRLLGELQELRAIFQDCLPIGDKTEKVDEYFNSLQEVICTNDYQANPDPLRREEFDHYDPDVQYSYISDVIFKERSGNQQLRALGQGLDHRPDGDEGKIPQLGRQVATDLAPIPECEADGFARYGDQDSDDPLW